MARADGYAYRREQMVDVLRRGGIRDQRLLEAMAQVPRHLFVPEALRHQAYSEDVSIHIGEGQTISQPRIVALMTEAARIRPDSRVLEVGTGSGYQAAILSRLVKKVYSMEIVKELSEAASERLKRNGYNNIETCVGNGYLGWPEHAPYDGVIATAAATHIPQALVEQLKPTGRLVIPVGLHGLHQELMLVEKDQNGESQVTSILGVAFVPMVDE